MTNPEEDIIIETVDEDDDISQENDDVISLVLMGDEDNEPTAEHNHEEPESEQEIIFVLDEVPGAPEAGEVTVSINEDKEEVKEEAVPEVDSWKWQHNSFLPWLSKMLSGVPKHSGYETTGLEKAISYFEVLDREITKAMRTDYKNEIDSAKAEQAREQIENGLERLIERLEKVRTSKYKRHAKKSRAWSEELGFVKEAQKSVPINGIVITVPLLISRIVRTLINGSISAGHDMEDMFEDLSKEYNLDKREKAEVCQLLSDMGYPVLQDRGIEVGKSVDKTSNKGFDWATNYNS